MKLKKVAAVCAKQGAFYLFDEVGEGGEIMRQWLGDGCAAYPISGLPYMDTDNICAMFDISEKKQEKMSLHHNSAPAGIDWGDTDPAERQLDDPKLCVRYGARDVLPLRTSEGIVFVQEKYLVPLEDMADYLHLYERKDTSGRTYIVAKNGMEIVAAISPVDIIEPDFVGMLETLAHKCCQALEAKRNREYLKTVERRPGPLFQEGGDAGEGAGECS